MNENAKVSEKRNEYSEHEIDEEEPAIDDYMVKFVCTGGVLYSIRIRDKFKELCQPYNKRLINILPYAFL